MIPIAAAELEALTFHSGPYAEGVMLRCSPPWTGEARGEISPVPESDVVADVHRPTCPTDFSTFRFPSDVARGPGAAPKGDEGAVAPHFRLAPLGPHLDSTEK